MLISESMQDEILSKIKQDVNDLDNVVLQDIITEWSPRRDEMIGLYNRSILQSYSGTYKQGGTSNDGKFSRSINYDGIPIFKLTLANQNNVNKPVHHDFLNVIKTNFQDYMTGNPVTIAYDTNNPEQDEENTKQINDWMRRESLQSKFGKLAGDDCQAGTAYMLLYQDGEEIHARALESHEAVVIYDTTGDPQLAVRLWDGKEKQLAEDKKVKEYSYTYVEVYDKETVKFFKAPGSITSNNVGNFVPWFRDLDGQTEPVNQIPHLLSDVPVVEFPKDDTRVGDIEKSIDLQDLYDLLDTGLNNEILQQAMAYIVMKGEGNVVDDEFKRALTDTGIFSIDSEGDVYYLEKNLNDDALSKSMERTKKAIYENSSSIDYAALTGDTRIMGLEQKLKKIDSSVTKTIRAWDIPMMNFWDIVFSYWNEFEGTDLQIENINVVYNKNKPRDVFAELDLFTRAGGVVSNKTKLEQLSFIKDADKEIARIEEEEASSPFLAEDMEIDGLAGTGDVQEAVEVAKLSGIQITSANDIISSVAQGMLTREAGINQLKVFLGLTDQQAQQVMGSGKPVVKKVVEQVEEG